MIIKSMSRKEPSFDQLASYMSSEKSDGAYDLYHHCFSRGRDDLVQEFMTNSQLLQKRKNGNYLYHEIVSILVKEGIDQSRAKQDLRDIAERYIEARCSRNMVYGCLHEDHDHNLHYHLMISANERGDRKRTRLTQKQFDAAKRDLEDHVLEQYPHLQQPQLINAETGSEKMSVKAGEVRRRMGAMPIRDEIKKTIREGMEQNQTMNDFVFYLSERGYSFYTRGKNFGVEVQHEDGSKKKYRFATLGIHEEFESFQNGLTSKQAEQQHSDDLRDTQTEETTSGIPEEIKQPQKASKPQEEILESEPKNEQTSKKKKQKTESLKKQQLREQLKKVRSENTDNRNKQNNEDGGSDQNNNGEQNI